MTFADYNNANTVYQARALRTIASLWVSNNSLLGVGVSLVLSSSQSRLISVLATVSSFQGVKTATISPLEVFTGPIVALPATVFLGIVVGVLGNFQCLFIFQGFSPYMSYSLGFVFYLYSFSSSNVFRVLFCFLILFMVLQIYLSSFLGRESGDKLWIMLATQLIEAQARQEGRASLYNQQSINEDPKLEKGRRRIAAPLDILCGP